MELYIQRDRGGDGSREEIIFLMGLNMIFPPYKRRVELLLFGCLKIFNT